MNPDSVDALLAGQTTGHAPTVASAPKRELPKQIIEATPFDEVAFEVSKRDSPRFTELVMDQAPLVPSADQAENPVDDVPYDGWDPLVQDLHVALHTEREPEINEGEVDPSVKLNQKLEPKLVRSKEFRKMKRICEGDRLMTEMVLAGLVEGVSQGLMDTMTEQIREQEEIRKKREEEQKLREEIEECGLPGDYPQPDTEGATPDPGGIGDPVPGEGEPEAEGDIEVPMPDGGEAPGAGEDDEAGDDETEDGPSGAGGDGDEEIGDEDDEDGESAGPGGLPEEVPLTDEQKADVEQKMRERDERAAEAEQLEDEETPLGHEAHKAIKDALQKGEEAAEAASHLPRFGAGKGPGEPVYKSAEHAFACAERWSKGRLRLIAELLGQIDSAMRYLRVTRAEGGFDEIVDVEFGDNLQRMHPEELAYMDDPDLGDDWIRRYASQELLQFATVGETTAGRGPVVIVLDGSESMEWGGEKRNIWARAVALALLHITHLDKRDFYAIEFSSGHQLAEWSFPGNAPLDGETVIDMAAHFFSGGTEPRQGIERAAAVMEKAPEFRKADIVLVGDGDAPFGPADEKIRDTLIDKGVRLFGMLVGPDVGDQSYIAKYCEHTVKVQDFDLEAPSDATAKLAQHLS